MPTPGERPEQDPSARVLNPLGRVPVSLIIDDSTCLVNLNRFAVPQFATAWGGHHERSEGARGRFTQPWRDWPVEIPDAFVRRFGEWCAEHGVRGKYSIVPYPACVGRIDRLLPGWTEADLDASIELVRAVMMPNWDIHPEMVTHTRVIDLKTGHPYPERGLHYQENWEWTTGRSVDELAEYMRYALRILENVDLPCEGITTPGGFGNRVLPELAQATLEACRDVFRAEIPHYFRHLYSEGEESVAPRVEYASGLEGPDPRCVVSIIGCTGDWTGGWDCSRRGEPDRFITSDLKAGRMVEVIERGEPAIMVCHWTGIYFNGEEDGFKTFQEVVRRLHARYDHLLWMKLSEIARYWAAKELTAIHREGNRFRLHAPFATTRFTLEVAAENARGVEFVHLDQAQRLTEGTGRRALASNTWLRDDRSVTLCIDLPRGESVIDLH